LTQCWKPQNDIFLTRIDINTKKVLDPVSSVSMLYKDACQLDAQMNGKIEQSKRHRYINIHLVQRQNNHAQDLKSTSQTTIIPIFLKGRKNKRIREVKENTWD
jgi:hypothetical protein